MFEDTYVFRGKHAEYVKKLTNEAKLFNRFLDVLILAPILGFLNSRKSKIDKGEKTAKVFTAQMIKERKKLEYIYQLITILDDSLDFNKEERMNIVFREEENKKFLDSFNDYVRGGVEFLFEKVYGIEEEGTGMNVSSTDQQEECLYNFITYIREFNKDLETESDEENIEQIISEFEM